MDAIRLSPPYTVGGWAWVYNSAASIRQGAKKDIDTSVLKTNFSLDWIEPFKILAVGLAPASDVPGNRPIHDKLIFLDIPSDQPERDSNHRVCVERCKPCCSPDDTNGIPKNLPADLTKYVLNSFTSKSPPFHVTFNYVSPPPERLEVEQVAGHQLVRGRGGFIAVLYEKHWVVLLSPSLER